MPYQIDKVGVNKYSVVNAVSGTVYSHGTSLAKARAQLRLLHAIDSLHIGRQRSRSTERKRLYLK
jgi:hypothetical protein